VVPIKYHERATAAPAWCADRVRCVAAGNLIHDVLTDADPGPAMARLVNRAQEWFGLDREDVRDIVERVGRSTRELASLFVIDTGPAADAERVLEMAAEQAAALAAVPQAPDPKPGSWEGAGLDGLVRDSQTIDPITGVLRRRLFDTVVRGAFDTAALHRGAMSIVQVNIDGFRALVAGRGLEAADEVLVASAKLLRKHFDAIGGVVCRWADDTFAVAIQGKSQAEILRAASEFRAAVEWVSRGWTLAADSRPLAVTVSIGAANFEGGVGGFQKGEQLIAAAVRAVEVSRASGGNCVRTFVPRLAA
jgi:diguanylate cyclase (GGDEF)-like protein